VQRTPLLPRVVAARPHPSAGALLEGPRCGAGPTSARGRGPRGVAERGHGQRRAAGPAGKKIGEGVRRKEKRGKELTCGPWLAGERRESGESARAGPREEKERERGKDGPDVAHAGRRRKRGEGDGPREERAGPRGGKEAGWAAFSNSFPFFLF
jgi:hypothetical protein